MDVMELRSSWTGNPWTAELGSLETSGRLTQRHGVTSQETGALLSICLIYRDTGNAGLQMSWRRDAATLQLHPQPRQVRVEEGSTCCMFRHTILHSSYHFNRTGIAQLV
jgi:hypothetical protein